MHGAIKLLVAALLCVVVVGPAQAQSPTPGPKSSVKEARVASPDQQVISPGEHPVLYATHRHFVSTQLLLKEMKRLNARAYHSGMVIQWYETYATKIEELPVVDVDEEVLHYSGTLAEKLRGLAASLRGSNNQVNVLNSYTRSSLYVQQPSLYWDWWVFDYQPGFIIAETNAPDVQTAKATVAAKGREERTKLLHSIDTDTTQVRRSMSIKYKFEFRS